MYQIYTHPKYVDYGKKFFDGVNNRYIEYSETLEKNLGIPKDELLPLIFIFVNATIHYSVFEDDFYLKVQLQLVKMAMAQLSEKYLKKLTKLLLLLLILITISIKIIVLY